jgi:hypothetical protein
MKKMLLFLILFLAAKNYTFAQPKEALKFLNIQPKWHHYSGLQANINIYDERLWGAKKALIFDDKVYFLTNIQGTAFVQGYVFEELNIHNGNVIYQKFYNTKAQNERKYAFAMKREGKDISLFMFKENTRILKNKPFLWAFSNMQTYKYCPSVQTMCDSIVTNPLDSLNKMILSWGQSLFKIKNNYLNVLHKIDYDSDKKVHYAVLPKLLLDKNGHLIDSTAIRIPFQYTVKNFSTIEYADNKYLAFIRAYNESNNEIKMAYFDENFNLEKVVDLSSKIPSNKGIYNLKYYDEKNIIISNQEAFYDNNVLKYRVTFSHFNHEGTKMSELVFIPETATYSGEDACILQPSQKMLARIHSKKNAKSALEFYTPDKDNMPVKLKTVELSHGITSRSMHPMPNNHFIFQGYYSDSTQFDNVNDNYATYTFWTMFSPESINFSLADKAPILESTRFFPNPTNDEINIETDLEYDAIKTYSIEGRLMQHIENQSNTINVSHLPTGLYFFELWQEGKAVTRKEKFVKME